MGKKYEIYELSETKRCNCKKSNKSSSLLARKKLSRNFSNIKLIRTSSSILIKTL